MKERCIDRSRVLSLSRIFCPALPLVGKRRRIRPEIACILMQSEVLPHSGLRTDSPARQGGEGIVVLRRVTLTLQADSSGAPAGLASRRSWTALSMLDVVPATDFASTPCHER